MEITLSKCQLSKNALILMIISCFMLMGFKPLVTEGVLRSKESILLSHIESPLLLNSDLAQAQEAEVSIVLWIEDGIIPNEISTKLPLPDWKWSYKDQQTKQGKLIASLTGHRVIDKNEERMLYTWYTSIAPVLAKDGVQIYLDERVPEAIDISAYLSQSNTLPSQWFLSDEMVSIAGYQRNLETSVLAGQDRINIQLLSRGQNNEGHTVLAIPVLLKEF